MKLANNSVLVVLAIVAQTRSPVWATQVDFDNSPSLPVGTRYGSSEGTLPGATVFTTADGISMSVETFSANQGTFTDLFRAEVVGPSINLFPTNSLSLDNIDVRFDFSGLGFPVSTVTLDYKDLGGTDNFIVNDHILTNFAYEFSPLNNVPINIAPGVTATASDTTITLSGPVSSFQIGGQELVIDNIVAVPEPSTILLLWSGLAIALGRRFRVARSRSAR